MGDDTLIDVIDLSKKFCLSIKRSMLYGFMDIFSSFFSRTESRDNLRAHEFWALKGVNIQVERGECLAVIGPNGSGKSTLLKIVNGLMRPDRGRVRIRGDVGALIELGAGFNPLLTGRENIYVYGAILGINSREMARRLDQIIDFSGIEPFIDSPVRSYSSGMRVRLGFAVASTLTPDVMLIDEVLAVGDAAFRLKCFNRIQEMIQSGTAAMLVSHNMSEVSRVATRGMVLDHGTVKYIGAVGDAIVEYERQLETKKRGDHETAQDKPKTVRVTTHDLNGTPRDIFDAGDDMQLHIEYSNPLKNEPYVEVTLLVMIVSPTLGPVGSFTNRVENVPLFLKSGNGVIRLKISDVPLLSGRYQIRIDMYNRNGDELFDMDHHAGDFTIRSPHQDPWKRYHTIFLKHEWLIPEDDLDPSNE